MTNRKRVVVADNDRAVIDLLLLDLRLEGHEVVATAADGESAIRACEEHDPDVVVTDLRLGPGINGLDVARQLEGHRARVLVYTNYVTPDVVTTARAVGAAVIEKGSLNALRRAIEG